MRRWSCGEKLPMCISVCIHLCRSVCMCVGGVCMDICIRLKHEWIQRLLQMQSQCGKRKEALFWNI